MATRHNRNSYSHHRRLTPKPWQLGIAVGVLLVAGVLVAAFAFNEKEPERIPSVVDSGGRSALLDVVWTGTPADKPASNKLAYKGFEMSFNPELHIPNYVAWELTADEATGTEPRNNNFAADPHVKGCASPADYKYSGYDRGHMAPAGDMKWDREAMNQSFFMTNIAPQARQLNTRAWRTLEEKCRNRAIADSAVIIVCGPIIGPDGPKARLGETGVAVPDAFFKVVLSPYSNPPRGIGFIMTNGEVVGGMQAAAVSIDSVERATGYDFFSALPDALEADIESRCEFQKWSRIAR